MSGENNQEEKFKVVSPKYDHTRIKPPYLISMLPSGFYPVIGQVIVTWAATEELFNIVLSALRKASPPAQTHPALRKRVIEFRKITEICFRDCPVVISIFDSMADDFARLAVDRNLLVHGEISVSNQNGGMLIAKGRIGNEIGEKEFSLCALEQLFYDLSHVGGKFLSVTMMPTTGGFYSPLPLNEKATLLDFCRANITIP